MSEEALQFEEQFERYGEALKKCSERLKKAASLAELELRDKVSGRSITRLREAAEDLEAIGNQVIQGAQDARAITLQEDKENEERKK